MRHEEQFRLDNRREGFCLANQLLRRIDHPLTLQLEGNAVVDVVADVFFVGEHLMHRAPRPVPTKIGQNAHGIETRGDLALDHPLLHEPAVHLAHNTDLILRSRPQHHAVGLEALVLAPLQLCLHLTGLVQQYPP